MHYKPEDDIGPESNDKNLSLQDIQNEIQEAEQALEEFSNVIDMLISQLGNFSHDPFEQFATSIHTYLQRFLNEKTIIIIDEKNIVDIITSYIYEFIKNCNIEDVDSDFYQLIWITSMLSSIEKKYATKISGSLIDYLSLIQTYPGCENKGYLYRLISNCIIQLDLANEFIISKFRIGTVYKDIEGLLRHGNEDDTFSVLFYLKTMAQLTDITNDESNIFVALFIEFAPNLRVDFLINFFKTFELITQKCANRLRYFEYLRDQKILEFLAQFYEIPEIYPCILPILTYMIQNNVMSEGDFMSQLDEILEILMRLSPKDQKFRLNYLYKLASLRSGHITIDYESLKEKVGSLFSILDNLTKSCKKEAADLIFQLVILGSKENVDQIIFDDFFEDFVALCDMPFNSTRINLLVTLDYGLNCAINNGNYTEIMENLDFSDFIDLAREMIDEGDDNAISQAQLFLTRFDFEEEV